MNIPLLFCHQAGPYGSSIPHSEHHYPGNNGYSAGQLQSFNIRNMQTNVVNYFILIFHSSIVYKPDSVINKFLTSFYKGVYKHKANTIIEIS